MLPFKMRVMLEIYGENQNNLRLTEEINIPNMMTLQQATEVLTKFSQLAQSIKGELKINGR